MEKYLQLIRIPCDRCGIKWLPKFTTDDVCPDCIDVMKLVKRIEDAKNKVRDKFGRFIKNES